MGIKWLVTICRWRIYVFLNVGEAGVQWPALRHSATVAAPIDTWPHQRSGMLGNSLESSINPVNSKTRAGCGSEHIHHCLRTEGANCSALSLLGQGWEHLLWAVTGAAKGPQPQPGQLLASRCLYCVKPGLGCCWESVGRSIHREIATFCLKLGHEKLVIDRIIASFLIPTAKIQVEEPINLLTETF